MIRIGYAKFLCDSFVSWYDDSETFLYCLEMISLERELMLISFQLWALMTLSFLSISIAVLKCSQYYPFIDPYHA